MPQRACGVWQGEGTGGGECGGGVNGRKAGWAGHDAAMRVALRQPARRARAEIKLAVVAVYANPQMAGWWRRVGPTAGGR